MLSTPGCRLMEFSASASEEVQFPYIKCGAYSVTIAVMTLRLYGLLSRETCSKAEYQLSPISGQDIVMIDRAAGIKAECCGRIGIFSPGGLSNADAAVKDVSCYFRLLAEPSICVNVLLEGDMCSDRFNPTLESSSFQAWHVRGT